jgi:hypothetical protein
MAKARSYMQLACQYGMKDGCTEYEEMQAAGLRRAPMTKQVAGFRLGMTRQEVAATCTRNHHQVSRVRNTAIACDGPAEAVGFDVFSVIMSFCDERLCDVIVSTDDSGMTQAAWQNDFDDLRGRLTNRYGPGVERNAGDGRFAVWRWYAPGGVVDSEIVLFAPDSKEFRMVNINYRNGAAFIAEKKRKLREESNL